MRVSNSKLKTYLRCQKQYDYKYVRGWRPKVKSVPLETGSWVHSLLEAYYKGKNWRKEHKRLKKVFNSYLEETREDLGFDLPDKCKNIMERYLARYPNDLDKYNVLATELDETVTLPSGDKLQIIIDLILEEKKTGDIWFFDHKSRKKFQDGEQGALDPQLTLYFYGGKQLGFKNLVGVCINEISTILPTLPPLLKSGGLAKRANLVCDVWTYRRELERHGIDPAPYGDYLLQLEVRNKDRFFRRTWMPKDPPMIKTMVKEAMYTARDIERSERKGVFPRTYIPRDCRWSCDYKDICITELQGGDPKELVKMFFETREQRERREKRERKIGEVKRRG